MTTKDYSHTDYSLGNSRLAHLLVCLRTNEMKIQIALSASGLKNVGARRGPFKRVSSPFAVVLLHPPAGGPADILGKTETCVQF